MTNTGSPQNLSSTLTLNDGHKIPIVGAGTYNMGSDAVTEKAVTTALELGYRHIDTASIYENERGVGAAIAKTLASGLLTREQLFVTTKVWNIEQGYENTLSAFAASLQRLQLAYVDLYLIHWPKPAHTLETWRAMKKLRAEGKIRSLGVSNFKEHHLKVLFNDDIVPVVNQVELHPEFQQVELKAFCERNHIYLEGWAPLIRGKVAELEILKKIARQYGKTPAQVSLRWQIQQNIITIPKSTHHKRLQENSELFDFTLSAENFTAIAKLEKERIWSDPDQIDF